MITFSVLSLEIYGDVSATCSFGKQDNVKRYPRSRVSLSIVIQVITESKIKWLMISAEWFLLKTTEGCQIKLN